jgi:uncharacterized OB-fold protein
MAAAARPQPVEDDRDTAGFWEAARRHELAVLTCQECGAVLHMPRAYCHHCRSWAVGWREVRGRGSLHSWTVVDHQAHPAFPVPYTVVLVQLDDAPEVRLVGHLPGEPELTVGQSMETWFETLDDGVVLPQWRPAPADQEERTT